MKDRLSIHINNGESDGIIREALTIMRNGGQVNQSGLVGITNKVYLEGQEPILPETIFNVQASGHSSVRFSSGPSVGEDFYKSSLELFGNGNFASSGLRITYDPTFDDAFVTLDPPEITYRHYVVQGCDDETYFVYDNNNLQPNSTYVEFADSEGNILCGYATGSFVDLESENGSSILSQGYSSCADPDCGTGDPGDPIFKVNFAFCNGGPTTTWYKLTPGLGDTPVVGDVVSVNIEGTIYCGEVTDTSQGSATYLITSITTCEDAICFTPPVEDPKYTVARKTGNPCVNEGTVDIIEDSLSLNLIVGDNIKYSIGATEYCGEVTGTSTGTKVGNTVAKYSLCTTCTDELEGGGGDDTIYIVTWNSETGGFCFEGITSNINNPLDLDIVVTDWVEFDFSGQTKCGQITGTASPDVTIQGSITAEITEEECDQCTAGGGGPTGAYGDFFIGEEENQCVDAGSFDKTVVDFSMVRAAGRQGFEFGHISLSERGYVGIGLTKANDTRKFDPNSPLTINYACDGHRDSGTIALRAQATSPNENGNYGKLYVKPYINGTLTQALFFQDDAGNETNLILAQELFPNDSTDGLIYCDLNNNTYGGWGTPRYRIQKNNITGNTLYGVATGFEIIDSIQADCNTMVGYSVGSGLEQYSSRNTVVGCESLSHYIAGSDNVVMGVKNLYKNGSAAGSVNNCILVGNNLGDNNELDDGTLQIGFGSNPLIQGVCDGSDKNLTINDGYFSIINTNDTALKLYSDYNGRWENIIDVIDEDNVSTEVPLLINFSGRTGASKTLFTIDPQGQERTNDPDYQGTFQFAQFDSDLRLQGAIRFQDGTSLSGISEFNTLPVAGTSGINIILDAQANPATNRFVLDFSELLLAGDVATEEVGTTNTFVSVQVDGTDSSLVGKMSLAGLAAVLLPEDFDPSISENCNVVTTNQENRVLINTSKNSSSVMIGCNVATAATGWKSSVIIGNEAGQNATTPNVGLSVDTAAVLIGYRAGYDIDNVENIICIGTEAGQGADTATGSTFIGSKAGKNTRYNNSVGIGENALSNPAYLGSNNIEIVAGFGENDSLMSVAGNVSDRLNIQNTIAGNTSTKNISIGRARLIPEAPLEVRRDADEHSGNPNNFIQSWHCDGTVVAAMECDGSLSGTFVEGVLDGNLSAAGGINSETTQTLSVHVNGMDTGLNVVVTNRDSNYSKTSGSYLLAVKIAGEYRPL